MNREGDEKGWFNLGEELSKKGVLVKLIVKNFNEYWVLKYCEVNFTNLMCNF